ncbi:alpha/beta hydrolase [soil metagenome]
MGRSPVVRVAPVLPRTLRFVTGSYLRAQVRRLPGLRGRGFDLPAARPTPGLTAQIAMDEVVLTVMMGPSRMPRRADYERLREEIPAARDLYGRRGWLADPASFHRPPPALSAGEVTSGRGWALGLSHEKLRFDSGYEPWDDEPGRDRWLAHEANRTGHAWVLRHRHDTLPDGSSRPWLVCLHGFGTGSPFMDIAGFRAGQLHRQLGFNLVFPILPLHGPRRCGRMSGDGYMSYDLVDGVHANAQSVWDVRRVIGWVRAQGGERIGVYGISLGGYVGALLATLEPDLDAIVAGIPPSDFPALFRHHMPKRLAGRARSYGLLGEDATALHRVVSPLAAPPRVPHDRRYLYAGLGDRMSTPAQAYRLWEHWDRPRIAWYAGNHVGYLWSGDVNRFVQQSLRHSGLAGSGLVPA